MQERAPAARAAAAETLRSLAALEIDPRLIRKLRIGSSRLYKLCWLDLWLNFEGSCKPWSLLTVPYNVLCHATTQTRPRSQPSPFCRSDNLASNLYCKVKSLRKEYAETSVEGWNIAKLQDISQIKKQDPKRWWSDFMIRVQSTGIWTWVWIWLQTWTWVVNTWIQLKFKFDLEYNLISKHQ